MQEPPIALHPRASGAQALPDPIGLQTRPKLKKLRIALVVLGLSFIALISTIFGMMMAVAGDLPALENSAEYRASQNSLLLADDHKGSGHEGTVIAKLTGNRNRILLAQNEISPNIKNAVVAIEDKRFYEHSGVDYEGIGRALWQDVSSQSSAQGASTITQQFVKNALAAQGDRSIFQKLKEAALAYHLERRWSKAEDPHPIPQHRSISATAPTASRRRIGRTTTGHPRRRPPRTSRPTRRPTRRRCWQR